MEAGVNPKDDPREWTEEPPTPDLTIVNSGEVDRSCYYCSMRRNDTLEQPLFLPNLNASVNWKQALIVVFRIVGVPGGEFLYRPEVSLLVLANAFGRPIGSCLGALPEPPVQTPHGLKSIRPMLTSRREMRLKSFAFTAQKISWLAFTFSGSWWRFSCRLLPNAWFISEANQRSSFFLQEAYCRLSRVHGASPHDSVCRTIVDSLLSCLTL